MLQRNYLQRISVACGAVVISTTCGAQTFAQSASNVVGRVGDRVVTMADLDEAWRRNDAMSRMLLLEELYDTHRRTLDALIGEILVDREATSRGAARAELLAQELPPRTLPVTDEDIAQVYRQNADAFPGQTQEQMEPQIRRVLEQQRRTQALQAYMEELVTAADDVQIEVEPPRTSVEVDPDDPVFGAASAAVVIVEFSDFQCPFCQQFSETLKRLKTVYGEDIRLVFKDYPLPNHMQDFKAAEAGHCANEQGNFWELHDTMFARQLELQIEDLKRYARELGLDQAAFDGCLDSGRFAETVLSDLTNGDRYGVSSTPTAFINGRVVMGDAPYDVLVEIIEEELDLAQQ